MKASVLCYVTSWAIFLTASVAAEEKDLERIVEQLHITQEQLHEANRRLQELSRQLPLRSSRSFEIRRQQRPMLGLIMAASNGKNGVTILGVTDQGPADQAGLKSGDIVTAIDGNVIEGDQAVRQAYDLLGDLEQGQEVLVSYRRDGQEHTATPIAAALDSVMELHSAGPLLKSWANGYLVKPNAFALNLDEFRDWAADFRGWQMDLQDLPQLRDPLGGARPGHRAPWVWRLGLNWSGLQLARINADLGRYFGVDQGVLVIDCDVEGLDLRGGDVLISLAQEPVSDPRQALRLLRRVRPGESVQLHIQRDGEEQSLTFAPADHSSASKRTQYPTVGTY